MSDDQAAEIVAAISEEYIHESNLIEGFDDPSMDACGLAAWTWLAGRTRNLTAEDVWFVHHVVVSRQPDPPWAGGEEWRGVWRTCDVSVGGRDCPEWRQVPELMDEWLAEMRDWEDLDPREMHVKFEHIHPFADGNGRTGRLLMWLHEVSLDEHPTLVRYRDVYDYFAWFKVDDEDEDEEDLDDED